MIKTDTIIAMLAEARERRVELKCEHANNRLACLSVSLNIPGYPKVSETSKRFFKRVVQEVKDFLLAHRILLNEGNEQYVEDAAGDYFVVPFVESSIDLFHAKQLCEKFEMQHKVGRIVDVDITDKFNQPISSGKTKACVLCKSKPAIICMHEKNHTVEEIRRFIEGLISNYLDEIRKKEVCRKLASYALKSILYEVSLTPKPGLVNKMDSGIHKDMDYYTFLDSSSIISTYFYDIALEGWIFKGELSSALPFIRKIGLEMERRMFEETGKVNTQKGIIFLIGISLFVSAYCDANNLSFEEIPSLIQQMGKPLKKELDEEIKGPKTHGEVCREKYGNEFGGGVRKEVIQGMPKVFKAALPHLNRLEENKRTKDKKLTAALLAIMAENNDTNVLYRSDIETLIVLKEMSNVALEDLLKNNSYSSFFELIEYCKKENISPGGSADLLATSIFFYYVNEQNQEND